MRFVPIKSIEQHDIQALHRIRSGLIQRRTALVNQIRGLLGEYGIVIAQGITQIGKYLPSILEDAENELTVLSREYFADLYRQYLYLNKQIKFYTDNLKRLCQQNEVCQRVTKIPGIGPLSATAIVASVGSAKDFKNGRELAAWLGLVPKQHSSGGKQMLLGISKRGDRYLRTLLIHGARSVIRQLKGKVSRQADWLNSLIERRGINKASVALANKNARTLWALIARGSQYQTIV